MSLIPKSVLNPDTSVMLGVANGGVILAIYSGYLPSVANIRTADPHDDDIESTRKGAAWTSAGFLGLMFLMTRDRNSFMIGGMVLAGVDFMVKHSNGLNPFTKKLDDPRAESLADMDASHSLPAYEEQHEPMASDVY